MYLSKVSLLSSSQSAKELVKLGANGAYASHQLLWQLFTEQKERNFLYREEMTAGGLPQFFVLSETRPVINNALFNVQTKSFDPQLSAGRRLAFKLRVNPTVCLKNEEGKSKRHDVLMNAKYQFKESGSTNQDEVKLLMDEAAHQWIAHPKRLEQWGIELGALPDIECYTQHKSLKKKHRVQFSSVDFQGVLTVSNPAVFWEQYKKGFGRAKAMGCGLMLIRPI
jgi:CRISPR system Cascade subunit CasE